MANRPLNPNSMPERNVTLSIVSHGQNALVNPLLDDVQRRCADRVALVLTENIPHPTPLAAGVEALPVEELPRVLGAAKPRLNRAQATVRPVSS